MTNEQTTDSLTDALTDELTHEDSRGARSPVLPELNITMLAQKSGLNRSNLSKLLNNSRYKVGIDVARALKEALGMETIEEVEGWVKECQRRAGNKKRRKPKTARST